MTDAPPPLALADQALIEIASAVVTSRGDELKNLAMWRDLLREVLPHVTRAHPVIRDLAAAADPLALTQRIDNDFLIGPDWQRQRFALQREITAIHSRRAGVAVDKLRAQAGEGRAA